MVRSATHGEVETRQQTLVDAESERYHKCTRREILLEEMDRITPWRELCGAIKPFYSNPQGAGRRPVGLERMPWIHFLQHWLNLSDPGVEEALYDSRATRAFVGIKLGREPVPGETTILKFLHLLDAHGLGERLFKLVGEYLGENGFQVSRGTIVDAAVIELPQSRKNCDRQPDPEMGSTWKGGGDISGGQPHAAGAFGGGDGGERA